LRSPTPVEKVRPWGRTEGSACSALAGLVAILAPAGTAAAATVFGVADDTPKGAPDGGASFFATMNDVGLTEDRITILWDAATPTAIPDRG
jgi:hypothetical protein